MSCTTIDPQKARNAIKNKLDFFNLKPPASVTQTDVIERLDAANEIFTQVIETDKKGVEKSSPYFGVSRFRDWYRAAVSAFQAPSTGEYADRLIRAP